MCYNLARGPRAPPAEVNTSPSMFGLVETPVTSPPLQNGLTIWNVTFHIQQTSTAI